MSSAPSAEASHPPTSATSRLSKILISLSSIHSQQSIVSVLSSTLHIKAKDNARVFLASYSAMNHLLDDSQEEVETFLHSRKEFYFAPYPALRNFFSPDNANQNWTSFRANLSDNDITKISYTAQALEDKNIQLKPNSGDLKAASDAIQEMQQALNEEGVSKHTRERLQECLDRIKAAVESFDVSGFRRIQEANQHLWGTIATDPVIRTDFEVNKQKEGDLTEKLMRVGKTIALILGLMHGVHQAKQDYLPALERYLLPHVSEATASNGHTVPHIDVKK